MMQISKRISLVYKDCEAAKKLAAEGRFEESDDFFIEAYANAIDLLESYDVSYFTDTEIEFLEAIIKDFEVE
jgi:hypothetical protein